MPSAARCRYAVSNLLLAIGLLLYGTPAAARVISVSVVDGTGASVTTGFRYLVEEDTTDDVQPGVHSAAVPSLDVHKIHSPVRASGHVAAPASSGAATVPDDVAGQPPKRYLVSILPDQGYTLSGAAVAGGQSAVTVIVQKHPIKTAQISVYAFHDNKPLNNAPDVPAEAPLAGFHVLVYDQLGNEMMDAFGNPLGTEYLLDAAGNYVPGPDGAPQVTAMGSGIILTSDGTNGLPAGEARVKNLVPGKYGIRLVPPAGEGWIQTSTLEGTPGVDAWVRAGEPPYFPEWGLASWHVFYGFVKQTDLFATIGPGVGTITGDVVYVHENRPPLQRGAEPGRPVPKCWVGLNDLGGADDMVYAAPCNEDSSFVITNVPSSTYQLVVWDEPLDAIIDFRTVIVPPGGGLIDLGKVPIFAWFGNLEGSIFFDANGDAFRDPGEGGVGGMVVNIRYPDASIYQSTTTDPAGDYAFNEIFPFFSYLIAEVDFGRYQATGMTAYIDDGGPLPGPGAVLTPQIQPGGLDHRTETGVALLEAFTVYAGQTNHIDWAKNNYAAGKNGGISGIGYYATTRAEDDARYATADPWEPGIPRVQYNLYRDGLPAAPGVPAILPDGVPDDVDGDGVFTLADVDNDPLGNFPGPEDVDQDGDGLFGAGDAVNVVWSDSWDDKLPAGCVGPPDMYTFGDLTASECAETLRTWNQVRPGVFDGGYAFTTYFPKGMTNPDPANVETDIATGFYIVEVKPPPGYLIQKEEDKNVDFGDAIVPAALPPVCVGDLHTVPDELTLFPGVGSFYAGDSRPLCDRKQVRVSPAQNTAADFFLFTEVPKAARIKGMALNDVLLEFDPNSPQRGTNYGVPWMPIAIRDFAGRELVRVYTDEWGKYNAIVPSTYTVNSPIPTGVSPHMLQICMNDPGPIPDPAHPGQKIIDPFYKTNHRRDCLTFDFWPGKTTYLDTPILPLGAFSANKVPPDCDYPNHTPLIQSAFGPGVFNGPYVPTAGSTLTLNAVGQVGTVDHGFGSTKGTVRIGTQLIPAANVTWSASTITAVIPAGVATGQLVVTRGDNGLATPIGLTVQVGAVSCGSGGPPPPASQCVLRVPAQYATIQAAVDAAPRDALILVGPGLFHENVIMYKRVKLQGAGLGTVIEAGPVTPEQQLLWDAKLASLRSAGLIDPITNQPLPNFYFDPGAGILVTGRSNTFGGTGQSMARVDGFTVTNASTGGAIYVNAWADNLRITNNRLAYNAGNFGGGLRVGTPSIPRGSGFESSRNRNMRISSNHITGNGAVDGGGGLSLFNGSDNYEVSDNFICGNFTLLYGGGIAHFGLSPGGRILRNKVVSNQSFDEGGGLIVAGELVSFDANAPLTPGSGSVTIDGNLIQGNLAGDDGGGIRTLMVNGQDVQGNPANWNTINIFNNLIVNNSSADAGGGVSLDDTLRAFIIHNTIAHNDSTATGPDAFGPCTGPICAGLEGGGITTSVPQVAGIGAFVTSAALEAASGQPYPDPYLHDNIVYENRSFYWDSDYNAGLGGLRPDVVGGEAPYYWDLGVYGVPGATPLLHPQYCILTDATLYPGAHNSAANPLLGDPYFNTYAVTSKGAAFGNFVTVTFPETGLWPSDYHIAFGSPAVNAGDTSYLMSPALGLDYDRQARPLTVGTAADIGADELQ